MLVKRLDNLQLLCSRHTHHSQRPTTVDGLPVEEASDTDAKKSDDDSSSEESRDGPAQAAKHDLADMESDEEMEAARA